MIYFDNSASTYIKPKSVLQTMQIAMQKYTANPGRSGHFLAMECANAINDVRNLVCSHFNADKPEHVIFTSGCTEALNMAILGTIKPNSHVIITINEHNSVIRPLFELKDKIGIEISIAEPSNKEKLTVEDILPHIKPNTQMICVNQMSNVDGMTTDIKAIGELCAEKCILFLVDGAQSAGHKIIDIQKNHIDLFATAGHKNLYGPQGVGILIFSSKSNLKPTKFGGTGTDTTNLLQPLTAPEAFESGTTCTPNILGLGAGIDFVKKNFNLINKKIDDLTTYLNFELRKINNVEVYTHPNNSNGVISFNIKGCSSTDISDILSSKYNIYTRSGLHCAPLKHKWLGTLKQGTVRISLSYFNTFGECEKFIKVIKIIANNH